MNPIKKILFITQRNFLFTILLLILIASLTGAFFFYTIEAKQNPNLHSFGQAIWWVLISMTTVGYGDVVPITAAGKLLGVLVIFTGVALVSMFTATVSSIFVAKKLKEERGLKQITDSNHIILCGWNHTAEQIINVIFQQPQSSPVVMIHQLPEDQVQNIMLKFKDQPLKYVRGDFAQEEILNRANLGKAQAVLIVPDASTGLTARTDEKTILTAFSVKALQPKLKVYAHILDRDNEPYLKKAQVDDYIISDSFSGVLMGEMVTHPGVPQSIQNLIGGGSGNHLERIAIPQELSGKTFGESISYFRTKNQLPIAIVKEQKSLSLSHVLSGDYSYLDEFIERKFRAAGRSLRKGEHLDVRINPPDDTVLEKDSFLVVIK
ncbi:MAG: ion channel [Calditrichia bacterium]